MPLRSPASLNRALLAAGLVDRLQVTIFPVISGRTGTSPIPGGAGDFDLELLDSRTLDATPRSAAWNAAYDLGWGVGALGVGLVGGSLGVPAGFAAAAVLALTALPLTRDARAARGANPANGH